MCEKKYSVSKQKFLDTSKRKYWSIIFVSETQFLSNFLLKRMGDFLCHNDFLSKMKCDKFSLSQRMIKPRTHLRKCSSRVASGAIPLAQPGHVSPNIVYGRYIYGNVVSITGNGVELGYIQNGQKTRIYMETFSELINPKMVLCNITLTPFTLRGIDNEKNV